MTKSTKSAQLGMNPSTASNRLVKDTLWRFVVLTGNDKCHRCGEPMERSNFSIEHKIPWIGSEDPAGHFFDQENVGFSHLECNVASSRRRQKYETPDQARSAKRQWDKDNRPYCPDRRKQQYSRTGK